MQTPPSRCPRCGNTTQWKEQVNALKTGIPGGPVRIRLFWSRGLLSKAINRALGFYDVKYRCKKCGFEGTYRLPEGM